MSRVLSITALLSLLALPLLLGLIHAQEKAATKERINPAGIEGSLLLCGRGPILESVRERFLELAGKEKANILIFVSMSESRQASELLQPWKAALATSASLETVPIPRPGEKSLLAEKIAKASGLWIEKCDREQMLAALWDKAVASEVQALLRRGGVIGAAGDSAGLLGASSLEKGKQRLSDPKGIGLLPGTVVALDASDDSGHKLLLTALAKNPGSLGLRLEPTTALLIRGRQMRVLGNGSVRAVLAASSSRPVRTIEWKAGASSDFTLLRRAALARSAPLFPAKEPVVPEVPQGSLVIVGGGGMPLDVTKKFIELAGGPEAPIVVLPIALSDEPDDRVNEGAMFQRAGARNVEPLRARTLREVEDPKTLEMLRKAKGVWFGGGRQWRFVDAYEGTKAQELFFDVLKRGGVIGGSSAGATIQGDYLCRGSPLGNLEMMCEGYERGMGFLPGTAIDQHFAQRNRFADMTALKKVYPQVLGLGIDEATALVVRGHIGEVMGKGKVQFYDRLTPTEDGKKDYEAVPAGGRYDLRERKTLLAPE